jgi:LPXTG-site transpeptidase (sortase) family protein
MTPDPTRPACRVTRGPARFTAGLALVAVMTSCSSGGNDASPDVARPEQTSDSVLTSPTPTVTRSATPVRRVQKARRDQAEGIDGPYTLRIPRIDVDAPVVSIESNEDRVLLPPRDPSVVGWWNEGAVPGAAEGSAILVGHTVRNNGGGIFDEMGSLRRGDTIEVEGSNASLTYRVQSVDVLSKDEVARDAEQIFTQTGPGRLVVITCDDWDGTVWRSNIITVAVPA